MKKCLLILLLFTSSFCYAQVTATKTTHRIMFCGLNFNHALVEKMDSINTYDATTGEIIYSLPVYKTETYASTDFQDDNNTGLSNKIKTLPATDSLHTVTVMDWDMREDKVVEQIFIEVQSDTKKLYYIDGATININVWKRMFAANSNISIRIKYIKLKNQPDPLKPDMVLLKK